MGIGKLANLTWSPAIILRSLPLFHNRCYVPWRHCQLHKNGPKFVDNDGGDWRTKKGQKKKKEENLLKVSIWVNNDDTAPGRRAVCECMHRPLSRNRTYRYGNTPLPLPTTITIVYTYTHTLVSCSPGPVWAQMVVNCITHLSVSGL